MKTKLTILTVVMLFAFSFNNYAQIFVPAKSLDKYFSKKQTLSLSSTGDLDCSATIIVGQEYTGVVGSPCVAFGFTSVYTKLGIINPPSMGLGYLFSFGQGTGLSNGSLSWTNKIALGACITTGFKPTSLSSMPSNIGAYIVWHSIALGGYWDTLNHLFGLSIGGAVNLTQIQSSLLSIKCLK